MIGFENIGKPEQTIDVQERKTGKPAKYDKMHRGEGKNEGKERGR